jgi:hypothetical protein
MRFQPSIARCVNDYCFLVSTQGNSDFSAIAGHQVLDLVENHGLVVFTIGLLGHADPKVYVKPVRGRIPRTDVARRI